MFKNILVLFVILTISAYSESYKPLVDSIKNKEIKEIVIFGDLPKIFALPMVVVDSTALQSSSFQTPAEALQRGTGISLSRDGVWATSVNVRGLSEQRMLLLVDGDRIQTATDIAGSLSTVDLNSLAKIEVIKGASSVLYGTGAMGGVINFVSERPSYTSNFQSKGRIGSEFNTVNQLWANTVKVQFTTRQWYLALNGSYRTAQNTKTPERVLQNSQFNDASWGLKGGIMYSPNEELLVNYQHVGAWYVGLPGGSAFPSSAAVQYLGVERNQLSGEYIISDINPNFHQLKLKAYTQNVSRDVEIVNFPITKLPRSLNRTYGAKITSDWQFSDYQSLVLGAEGWERKAETSRLKLKTTTSDSTDTAWGEQPTPNAKMFDIGAFAHYSWKINPRNLTLNAGLRLDYIQTSNDSAYNPVFQYSVNKGVRTYVNGLVRNILFLPNSKNDFSYSAHLDLVFKLTAQQQLALSVSNSYRVPSIEERFKYIDLGTTETIPLHIGNPDLKPELGTFSNLNYTLSSHHFNLKFDIFANYLENLITEKMGVYTYLNTNGINTTVNAFINSNVSKALLFGFETEMNWLITEDLNILANASFTHAKDVVANVFLPQIPPLHGFSAINYHFDNGIGVSFSTLWAARQAQVASGENSTDSHIIFNLDVQSAKIIIKNSYLQLYAGANNLLNTAYYNHLTSTRNGGIMYQEPGRNIYLKVKWGW
jgi:hemoglobin/transferrin/lactoferrin receptor protein